MDIVGKKFYKLTVLAVQNKFLLCKCDCGVETKLVTQRVLNGAFRSCRSCYKERDIILKAFFQKFYHEKKWSVVSLGKFLNLHQMTIWRHFKRFKIPTRDRVAAGRLALKKLNYNPPSKAHKEALSKSLKRYNESLSSKEKEILNFKKKRMRGLPKEEKDRIRNLINNISSFNSELNYSFIIEICKKRNWKFEENITRYVLGQEINVRLLILDYNLVIKIDNDLHYTPLYGDEYLENMQKKDTHENMYMREAGYSVLRIRFQKFDDAWLRLFSIKLRRIKKYGQPSIWYM